MSVCPVPGCARVCRAGELLCGVHWRPLSGEVKNRVWSTWRAFTKATTSATRLAKRGPYFEARQAAIEAAHQAESPLCG